MKPQIPWLRVFVEGVVIVVSILLAFGIEAWWDGVQEREEVRRDLVNVAQELTENRERVLIEIEWMERLSAGSAAIVEILESAQASGEASLPDTLSFLGTTNPSTLNASLGALDALIASGRLARIEDPRLRRGLAGLRDQIEDATETQLTLLDDTRTYLMPLLDAEREGVLEIAVANSYWMHQDRILERGLVGQGQVNFPNRQWLLNFLRRRTVQLRFIDVEMEGLLQRVDTLIQLIGESSG